jgi:hypothetical protein
MSAVKCYSFQSKNNLYAKSFGREWLIPRKNIPRITEQICIRAQNPLATFGGFLTYKRSDHDGLGLHNLKL